MNSKHDDHGETATGPRLDCSEVRDWLDLIVDGEALDAEALQLSAAVDRAALRGHLAGCPECRTERRALEELTATLNASRVPVNRDFQTAVMSSLPAAGWEGASPRTWAWPMALLVLLAVSTASLLGFSSARLHPEAPFLGALAAIGDLASTSLLAGAGLLSASWQGLGLAIGEMLTASRGNLVAFVALVIAINGWLYLLLRRRAVEAKGRERR
ncbi:MAG: hypothetical protein AAF481_08905 [Acidobacteriota bacterium]